MNVGINVYFFLLKMKEFYKNLDINQFFLYIIFNINKNALIIQNTV